MTNGKARGRAAKLHVRVCSGAQGSICKKYSLEDGLVRRKVAVGKLSHIIGQANTNNLSRGTWTTPRVEPNDANKLVLTSPNDHTAIDRKRLAEVPGTAVELPRESGSEAAWAAGEPHGGRRNGRVVEARRPEGRSRRRAIDRTTERKQLT